MTRTMLEWLERDEVLIRVHAASVRAVREGHKMKTIVGKGVAVNLDDDAAPASEVNAARI